MGRRALPKPPYKMYPVEVSWTDAAMLAAYREYDDESIVGLLYMRSVGYLSKCTKDEVRLVLSHDQGTQVSDTLCIPRRCVTKIRRLKPR